MADIVAKVEGLEEVHRKFARLKNPKALRAAVRRAGTKAMRPVRDAARAGAARLDDPHTASNIAKNIITRAGSRKNEAAYGGVGGNVVVTKVGVAGGAKSYKSNKANDRAGRSGQSYHVDDPATFHWRFLELGTSKMGARPFMEPALKGNVENVTGIYASLLSTELDKALK